MNLSSLNDPSDYLAGHLDKKVNEDSARGSLPVQGWRWQKRFFIVSDSQRALFYFKCELRLGGLVGVAHLFAAGCCLGPLLTAASSVCSKAAGQCNQR